MTTREFADFLHTEVLNFMTSNLNERQDWALGDFFPG